MTLALPIGILKRFIPLLLFAGLPLMSMAQNVTVAGALVGNGTYPQLNAAFTAINGGAQTGSNIVISIVNNTTEATSAILNANDWSSLTISPAGGTTRTIAGDMPGYIIDLAGADNVTINGLNTGGNALVVENISIGPSGTINFRDDASANTITNLTLRSSGNSNTFGNINFGAGLVTGNDNNIVSLSTLEGSGANFPATQIFSNGSATAGVENSGNTITNCNVSNFYSAIIQSYGINITNTGNFNWTISNNRIYQTATRTYTTANTHFGITLSGGNSSITNNIIGFTTNTGTGTYTMAGTIATRFIAINMAANNTTTSTISGNIITAFSLNTSSGVATTNGIFCGINVTSGKVNVSNNTIGANSGTGAIVTTSTTTGSLLVGINCQANTAGDSVFVQNNQIGALTNSGVTATTAGSITGINVSAVNQHVRIINNTIGNTTADNIMGGNSGFTTGSSLVVGINLPSMPVNPIITGNTVRNLASYGTGTTGTVRGIGTAAATGNPNSFTIENNIFENFVTNNSNSSLANGATGCNGIQIGVGTNNIVRNNTIRNISNINTGTTQSYVVGIAHGNGTNTIIEKNTIHSLSNAGTSVTAATPSVIAGIVVRSGTTAININNNMISLGTGITNNNAIVGIQLNNGSTPDPLSNIYHNTINISGTVAAGAQPSFGICRTDFGATARTAAVDIKNNIVTNSRNGGTGQHFAIGNNYGAVTSSATGWGAGASNNNVLNSTAGTIGFWTTAQTFAGWQTASNGDLLSYSGVTVTYVNPANNLHLNMGVTPTVIESSGQTIPSVTTDIDGQVRPGPAGSVNGGAFAPDLGADEFDGVYLDVQAPTITYTPLNFICSTGDRILTATIVDYSGVPTSGGLQPRIYFRKNAGAWFSNQGTLTSGTGSNGTWNFTISSATIGGLVIGDVVEYYAIAQDVMGTPNITSNPSAGLVASNVNTVTTAPTTPNSYSISDILNGTYTVGVTGTYTTLTAAINAYNNSCLSGPVTFSLIDATYPSETFPMVINPNADASSTNTLTIQPASGNNVTISGSSAVAILQISGGNYVTINGSNTNAANSICPLSTASRNLTITNTNTSTNSAVVTLNTNAAGNAATNNKVLNCIVIGNASTTTGVGINISGPSVGSGVGANGNNNNQVINNQIQQVQVGIFSSGVSSTNKNLNNVYELNELNSSGTLSIGRIGIMVLFEDQPMIRSNKIGNIINSVSQDVIGITIGTNAISNTVTTGAEVTNATVTGNTIENLVQTNTFSSGGIVVASSTDTNLVSNNIINGVFCNGTAGDFAVGIFYGGGTGLLRAYHNTVNVTGATLTGASQPNMALGINGTSPNVDIRNNIFMCSGSNGFNGNTGIGVGYTGTTGAYANLLCNYNDIVVSGTSSSVGRTGSLAPAGVQRVTLLDWQTETGADANSALVNPTFVGANDLHLVAGSNTGIENVGTPLALVTNDVDCDTRTSTPDLGADEVCFLPSTPTIIASVNPTCSGDTTVISINSGALNDAANWEWYSATCGGTSVGSGDTIVVTPLSTTDYFVRAEGGCVNPTTCENISITVNPLPVVSYTATLNDSICVGDSIILSGTGANLYNWSGGIIDGLEFAPAGSGSYIVTGTDLNGCSNTDTAMITVHPLPVVSYSALPNDSICAGSSLTLSGSGANSYVWSGSISDGVSFIPASSGSYIVTGTDLNGCSNTDTAAIVVNPNPVANLGADIVQPNPPAVLDAGSGFTSYLWSTTESTQTISVTSNGIYHVTVTNANGCSDSDTIQVNFTSGIQNTNGSHSIISLFPNPSDGVFNLYISNLISDEVIINMMDMNGKIVMVQNPLEVNGEYSTSFNISELGAGIYLMTITANGQSETLRIVKK